MVTVNDKQREWTKPELKKREIGLITKNNVLDVDDGDGAS